MHHNLIIKDGDTTKVAKEVLVDGIQFVDEKPRAGSTNPVTSDGIASAITEAVGGASDALQEQIDDIAEKAGSGYIPKGPASVATLNGLTGQENGWLYTMTDAGTLTDGSLAVNAGDTVAWDETNSVWYPAMDYAPRQYGTNEVHNLPNTITAFRTGDVIPVDGPSGTAKMGKNDLLREAAENALAGNVAPAFDATKPNDAGGYAYYTGDPCEYGGKLYLFKTDKTSGAWDASYVRLSNVSDMIDRKKNQCEQIANSNLIRIDELGITRMTESNLSAAYVGSDAYIAPTSWTYINNPSYDYKTFAVEEGDIIRVKGSVDVDTKFTFTNNIYSVTQTNYIALLFRTYGRMSFDFYFKVPAGATYVLISGKKNDFPIVSKITAATLDPDKIPDESISPNKLSEEIWSRVKIPIASDYVVADSRSNQTGTYISNDTDYDLISYPVNVGDTIQMVSYVDKSCGWHFCDWKYSVYGHVVSTPFAVPASEVPTDVNVLAVVPSGATHLIASVKKNTTVNIYKVSETKAIPSDVVSGIGKTTIFVSPSGNDVTGDGTEFNPFATIKKANDSISMSGKELRYVIKVADGTYNDLETLYAGVAPEGSLQGVVCKPYVEYVGNVDHPENVVLVWDGKEGYDDTWTYESVGFYKCLFHLTKTSAIRGFTFRSINTRYALHVETGGYGDNVLWEVSDCVFEWGGVPGRVSQPAAIGTGSSHFEKGHLLRCVVKNADGVPDGFMNHDSAYNYGKPYREGADICIESCNFGAGAQGDTNVIFRSINGDNTVDGYNRCEVVNCIGINKFGYELLGTSTEINWRAEVKCSDIENNEFETNGKMQ